MTSYSNGFGELELSPLRLAAVEAAGWRVPTPIQRGAIPPALAGRDIVGIAQTGTGKTGAFMIPALEGIEAEGGLQVLILCPTRELAQQVAGDTRILARGTKIRVEVIQGGVSYDAQNRALREGFEVIAATPGRLIDHLERGNADLGRLRFLVLDEADRLLDMGFRPQIEQVLRRAPRKRRTLLFSATMPPGVHDLSLRITKDPAWVEASPSGTKAEGIEEAVYSVRPDKKVGLLLHLLESAHWDQVLVFTRTKVGADALRLRLERAGVRTEAMHSDRRMKERGRALDRLEKGEVRVLVATDIAQRGLDVDGITHVVNYDIPLDPEDYIHRIGRTGRMGASGNAVIFVTAGDLGALKTLEYRLGRQLERIHLQEFDYAGTSALEVREEAREKKHARSSSRMGSRLDEELTPEELSALLSFE